MAISITDLDYTDNMASSKQPFLTDIRETLDSIETYINDSLKDNIEQIAKDCFPSAYALDSNGLKNFGTYNLYDKQTEVQTYTGGDKTITTTGSWIDLDATNAKVTFTPDYLAGDFKVIAQFMASCVTTNGTNEIEVRFRLTDSSENSSAVATVHMVTGVTATTYVIPITLMHEFDNLAVSAQTVKIQYFIVTKTATSLKVLANTNEPLNLQVEKI